ncbi:hypothetical protein QVD17_11255 [Tagetes erecta]|uniref:Uncharacterized protein n=1 Tax=Tagetes erecta TaxID=13708 RepID=A0AAD8KXK2_TARER|nr:hypothetical protein QVD17_11255 [Tagetes erecta]
MWLEPNLTRSPANKSKKGFCFQNQDQKLNVILLNWSIYTFWKTLTCFRSGVLCYLAETINLTLGFEQLNFADWKLSRCYWQLKSVGEVRF